MAKEKIKIAKVDEKPEPKKKVTVKKAKKVTEKKEKVVEAAPKEVVEAKNEPILAEEKILETMTAEEKAAPVDYEKVDIKKTLVYFGIILIAMALAFIAFVF